MTSCGRCGRDEAKPWGSGWRRCLCCNAMFCEECFTEHLNVPCEYVPPVNDRAAVAIREQANRYSGGIDPVTDRPYSNKRALRELHERKIEAINRDNAKQGLPQVRIKQGPFNQ